MLKKLPKARREVQADLSGLTTEQLLVRRNVVALGELAFGSRWQTDLAAAISHEVGRRIGQAQVSHWISGERPVPKALVRPLQRVAVQLAEELERRAAVIRADWAEELSAEDNAAVKGLPWLR